MGNSFNKIDNEINRTKIENYDTVDSLGWKDTENFVDTVDTLGWKDTENFVDTVNTLGWNNDIVNTDSTSSPFISTELYNKIMNKEETNVMQGGKSHMSTSSLNIEFTEDSSSSDSSETSSTSTSELSQMLSLSDYKSKKDQTGSSIEAYGFSNTSSELSQQFNINSDTSISKMDNSSSINTSDINLVSIDKNSSDINVVSANSVNGKRYL